MLYDVFFWGGKKGRKKARFVMLYQFLKSWEKIFVFLCVVLKRVIEKGLVCQIQGKEKSLPDLHVAGITYIYGSIEQRIWDNMY